MKGSPGRGLRKAIAVYALDLLSVLRIHIIGIAVLAAWVFGWLASGQDLIGVAAVAGLDWLFINLLNRVTDVEEDLANAIRGAEAVARRRRGLLALTLGALALSFPLVHAAWPHLLPWRLIVQAIGLGYSLRLVWTPSGWKRFKDLYFLKNFLSAVLFVLTCFVYPYATAGAAALPGGTVSLALLAFFFVPFELTYEILYDLRDIEGDRMVGVPTYPVVHGAPRARQIIDALLVLCTFPLLAGLLGGALGLREGLLLAAPLVQLGCYRASYRRGVSARDCIAITHLGSLLLLVYLVGNRAWLAWGLPPNILLSFGLGG